MTDELQGLSAFLRAQAYGLQCDVVIPTSTAPNYNPHTLQITCLVQWATAVDELQAARATPADHIVDANKKVDAQSVRDAWIPVSERLPEQHEWVLVSDGTWSAIGTHLDDEDLEPNKRWMDESAELIESNGIKITHWQPLPQPPKG